MFTIFKEEREESQFNWSVLGDIEEGRPNLGPLLHVSVYRMMQYTLRDSLIRDFDVETADRILFETSEEEVPELYAKVIRLLDEAGKRYLIHFTSVPHRIRERLRQIEKGTWSL